MYNFPNFDNDTRFIMVSELVRDIENGLFYEPSSLQSNYIARYKELLGFTKDKKRIRTITFEDILFKNFPLVGNPFKMYISTFKNI